MVAVWGGSTPPTMIYARQGVALHGSARYGKEWPRLEWQGVAMQG